MRRARGLPRAEVEVGAEAGAVAARGSRQARGLGARRRSGRPRGGTSRPTSSTVVGAGERGPDLATLGERRQRHLHDEHGGVSQRNGGLARARADEQRPLAGRERALDPDALARIEPLEPVEAEPRAGERGRERRRRAAAGSTARATSSSDERPLERDGQQGGRVRPGDDDRQAALDAEQGAELGHGRRAVRGRTAAVEPAQAAVARGLVERGAEQERSQAVGGLELALGQRDRRRRRRAAARRRARAAGRRARSRRARRSRAAPWPASSRADEARAGELPGHVVVQVGVEAAVARAQLRRGADREHRALQRRRDRASRRRRRAARRARRPPLAGEAQRLLVRDVEAAEGVERVRVAGGDALDGLANTGLQRCEQARRRWGETQPRPRAACSASRSSGSPGCETRSGPRCGRPALLARRAPARERSAPCPRSTRACTGRRRRRGRCRS